MGISIIVKIKNNYIEYELHQVCRIGRSSNCHIVVNDIKISSEHLEIKILHTGVIVFTDLNSRNGTYLNGTYLNGIRTMSDQLKANDSLKIGDTIISLNLIQLSNGEKSLIGERNLELNKTVTKIKR